MPDFCPCCNTPVVRKQLLQKLSKAETEAGDKAKMSIVRYCPNDACPDRIKGMIGHWCGKEAMDIEDVGDAAIATLVDAMGINGVDQLYSLTQAKLTRAGFGPGEAVNLMTRIETSKARGMEYVLVGLGMDRIGSTWSRRLAKQYPDIFAFFADREGWKSKGLGTADIAALKAVTDSYALPLVNKLKDAGVDMKSTTYSAAAAAGALSGKTLCFTGALTIERDAATRMAEGAGAKVTSSVSKKTSILVVGEDAGSKLTKAKELGIRILNETEFLALVGEQ